MSDKPLCLISGPVFSRSGYGGLANDLAKSLIRQDKYEILIAPTRWGGCPSITSYDELTDPVDRLVASKILTQNLTRQPDLFVQISIPNEFNPIGKYNIGITAGIETTLASGEFVEGLNRMNMNIVTSNHAKKVFESAQYQKKTPDGKIEDVRSSKPIEVCFWGADTNVYKMTNEKNETLEHALSVIPETFAFLFVGQWTHGSVFGDRKNIGNLIKTFLNAFKDRPDKPCLILKTSGVNFSKIDRDETLRKIKEVEDSVSGDLPKVYLLHGDLTDVEMNALYNHEKVKVHISFTKGEGAGRPILEATLSGKPVMVSNWSGHLDYLNPKYAILLDGVVKQIEPESVNQWLIAESAWFNVSFSLAQEKMRKIYFSYGESVLEKAKLLAEENKEKFSLPAMDKVFHGIIDKYVPQFSVQTKISLPKLKKISLPPIENK